ncbi:DUF2190 family protein [Roseomonas genomospecies 6]|uniref:DUF2190 family protein n=1 Tax=Roseomonas genomospecies 6 TaxID=214106 RepID=A0A9W7KQM4_9PROT|nr:capsid cement protein [Roseomonas genomospecies 6]KAA0677779.1 DUF2190 family protein [Roseomonas genomospecies 6]
MKNFIQAGTVVSVTAPATVTSGSLVKVGALFGVAVTDAASGAAVEISTEGVYTLPKVTTDTIAIGDKLYWDDTAKLVTKTATNNTLIGVALSVGGNPSATVNVRLNDCFGI